MVTLLLLIAQVAKGSDNLIAMISFCGMCTSLVYATNMLMAMIYRWRHAGKVCSGDYRDERYAFMEAPEPYAADAGFFLLLAICSQFFACFTMMNAGGLAVGLDKRR